MKISKTPTKYLLVTASNSSEWDGCDFAVITVDDEFFSHLRRNFEVITGLTEDQKASLLSMKFHNYFTDFFITNEHTEEVIQTLEIEEHGIAWVELEDDEFSMFEEPETSLRGDGMMIHKDGNFRLQAYGKHTGEIFWTEWIDAQWLIDQSQPVVLPT